MSKLVTQAEFARMCGVNRSTVHKWIGAGRIQTEPSGLIDPEAAMRMREATESPMPHHQARKAQFEQGRMGGDEGQAEKNAPRADFGGQATAATGATDTVIEPDLTLEEIQKRTKIAVMRHQEASALAKENEAKRQAGELYEREAVESAWAGALVTFRTTLETLPDRVAPAIARHRGDVAAIHHELADNVGTLLRELSDDFRHRMAKES
jgi:hypothetical protein